VSKSIKVRVSHDVEKLIRSLHPLLKKRVRAALEEISRDPHCGKALKDELTGLWNFRIKRFRIIYKLSRKGQISVVAIGPRKYIYEETFRILSRQYKDKK
jgi:mRNA interferase RelE/StbE